ncbi:MAG: ATP-dependent DNA helicase RecG [Cryomorphaceae bacterium]|nr:ATP-dependent DNA helicase RecG [Cryomorphaceae bacterium]
MFDEYDKVAKTPIEYLKGVGPSRGALLRSELGIASFGDLLFHFPFRYVDRSKFYQISEISQAPGEVQIKGKLILLNEVVGQKNSRRLVGKFSDGQQNIDLIWFKSVANIKKILKVNTAYILYGKPQLYNGAWNIVHPELEPLETATKSEFGTLFPVYSSTEKLTAKGLNGKGIARLFRALLPHFKGVIPENLPSEIIEVLRLVPRSEALFQVHFPRDSKSLQRARFRLKYEEFFFIQLGMVRQKRINQTQIKGNVIARVGERFNAFYQNHLPFELTGAQKRVVKEIRKDMGSGAQMNRLLQGDVGSGKTMVALLSMLLVIDEGFQACLMAPTEILARQHFLGLSELLDPMGLRVELLTGSTPQSQRKILHEDLSSGELPIIVGTHALLEEKVKFANLGLAVIDEQHRFGVAQRARLWKKNTIPPHILVMTATPIPRTLAMSLYGDLDISVIDELPPGRKPIQTLHYLENKRLALNGFLKQQISEGRQVYIVYPLIQESAKQDYQDLVSGFESITRAFPEPDYHVSVVHGNLSAQEKEAEMQAFVKGQTQIMVATTVIEVGVNVPNASVMVIESAERFGLSQLHQLRGRVGRGASQSFCILMTGYRLGEEARTRMETMVRTNDGFEISEVDLRLRGPGEMTGTQQSGSLQFKIADLVKDGGILSQARADAIRLLQRDAELRSPENAPTREFYLRYCKYNQSWSRIS